MSLASQLTLAFQRVAQEIKARDQGKAVRTVGPASQSVAVGSNTMTLATSFNDDVAYYTVNASNIKILKPGLYLVTWGGTINAAGSSALFAQQNGATIGSQGVSAAGDVSGSTVIRAAANDTLTLNMYYNNAGTLTAGIFAIARLGL